MRYSAKAALPLLALTLALTKSSAFVFNTFGVMKAVSYRTSKVAMSSPQADVVDIATFRASIETLENDAGASSGITGGENPAYAIGKTVVNLPVVPMPGLDLTESAGLVLVSGVFGETAETGLQLYDTIVRVSTADGAFQASTKAVSLEETAGALQAATSHAIDAMDEGGRVEIDIEVNRLIRLQEATD